MYERRISIKKRKKERENKDKKFLTGLPVALRSKVPSLQMTIACAKVI